MDSDDPPPPYREQDTPRPTLRQSKSTQFKVSRKPLASSIPEIPSLGSGQHVSPCRSIRSNRSMVDLRHERPDLPPRPELSLQSIHSRASTNCGEAWNTRRNNNGILTGQSSTSTIASFPFTTSSSMSTPDSTTIPQSSSTNLIQKTFQDVRHLAGGLISRPVESTKNFTILRHSHGLVFYQGTSTTLAISIFSDAPLPPDRTLWLQSKGWSGETGMRLKALVGRNGSWLDVTPTMAVKPEQLNPPDERAWQRDFAKFRDKGPSKLRDRHILRETAIIRIPAEAGDGYFQFVMCVGDRRKVLCPSPVFRLLSTSASPHSLRGASLATLPLELGAMFLTTYTTKKAALVLGPVTAVVSAKVQQYMPSFWTEKAIIMARDVTGFDSKFDEASSGFELARDLSLLMAGSMEFAPEDGPRAPYPIRIAGRARLGRGDMVEELGMPVFDLSGPDESLMVKLHGYYFGWARNLDTARKDEGEWCQAIISAVPVSSSQLARAKVSHANKRNLTLRLLSNGDGTPSNQARFEVRILGFIRPDEPTQRAALDDGIQAGDQAAHEAALLSEVNDIQMVHQILEHPHWSPKADSGAMVLGKKSNMSKITDKYAKTRLTAQRQMDKLQLDKVGVRLEGDKIKDKAIFTNGFYVVR